MKKGIFIVLALFLTSLFSYLEACNPHNIRTEAALNEIFDDWPNVTVDPSSDTDYSTVVRITLDDGSVISRHFEGGPWQRVMDAWDWIQENNIAPGDGTFEESEYEG
ncbi:MAG: hypothetical protein D6805_09945 [Planctomycetota bacterium]|nr:MAG: hypothetical protein D6805_09945 [Planctomycetota bacterium]